MKISHEQVIMIKNLSVKVVWWTEAAECISQQGLEFGSIDNLLKRIRTTGTTVWQPGSGRHSFGPTGFCNGIIVPLLKCKHGDASQLDMYCVTTLSPVLSKLNLFYLICLVCF